jgi:hypothetical protein
MGWGQAQVETQRRAGRRCCVPPLPPPAPADALRAPMLQSHALNHSVPLATTLPPQRIKSVITYTTIRYNNMVTWVAPVVVPQRAAHDLARARRHAVDQHRQRLLRDGRAAVLDRLAGLLLLRSGVRCIPIRCWHLPHACVRAGSLPHLEPGPTTSLFSLVSGAASPGPRSGSRSEPDPVALRVKTPLASRP